MNKKLEKGFYVWMTLVPIFCVFLDLFFSTIQPDDQFGYATVYFDYSIISQSLYLSVWTSMATFAYGIINWIHMDWNNMPKWAVGKNNLTRIVTLNLFTFIIYNVTLSVAKDSVAGFSTWYNIIKSVLEHMLTPILIITFYYLYKKQFFDTRTYTLKYSWFNLILTGIYLLYLIVRSQMLLKFAPTNIDPQTGHETTSAFTPFPYPQVDPTKIGYPLFFLIIFAGWSSLWAMAIGFNWSSNKLYKQNFETINENLLNKQTQR